MHVLGLSLGHFYNLGSSLMFAGFGSAGSKWGLFLLGVMVKLEGSSKGQSSTSGH